MRRRDAERGAMAPVVAAACLVIVAFAIGGFTIGRIAVVRQNAQRAVDAACLEGAMLIREEGLPFNDPKRLRATQMGQLNSPIPVNVSFAVVEDADKAELECQASVPIDVPSFIYPSGSTVVTTHAKAKISQHRFDEAERHVPKLVMVLDYSGSMSSCKMNGSTLKSIDVLRSAINQLLDKGFEVEYGAVIYSDNAFKFVNIGPATEGAIRSAITVSTRNMTNTGDGLVRAANMLAASGRDDGRNVLLVTDGVPTAPPSGPEAKTREGANAVWAAAGNMFTLHVNNSRDTACYGSSWATVEANMQTLLTSISGLATDHPDSSYFYRADDPASLNELFTTIMSIILCTIGPIDAPGDPDCSSCANDVTTCNECSLRVFLRSPAGDEEPLPQLKYPCKVTNLEGECEWDDESITDKLYYQYNRDGDGMIRITRAACDKIMEEGYITVLRYDDPGLTD